jgi:hypothetical protein
MGVPAKTMKLESLQNFPGYSYGLFLEGDLDIYGLKKCD